VAERAFAALERRDLEALLDLVDPDVEFTSPDRGSGGTDVWGTRRSAGVVVGEGDFFRTREEALATAGAAE
jgi:ketosteroid isomerase-like protein